MMNSFVAFKKCAQFNSPGYTAPIDSFDINISIAPFLSPFKLQSDM